MSFREERAAERKMNMIKVAARLFSEKGYHDTTLEDIAKNLKYTKGSIYYYILAANRNCFSSAKNWPWIC